MRYACLRVAASAKAGSMRQAIFCMMAIRIPIEDWIDLHTFSPKEIPSLLEEYLLECQKKGFKEVRIIHGKGKGVQRNIVHSFLKKSPLIDSFRMAPPEAGAWGATIVTIKQE
jgi:DNA-nicking Smr family endonuclease